MNRRLTGISAIVLGLVLAGGIALADRVIPQQHIPEEKLSVAAAGVYACPVSDPERSTTSVFLSARGDGVSAQSMSGGASRRPVAAGQRLTFEKASEAVRVDADPGDLAGGISVTAEISGLNKGLGAAPCQIPRTEQWLTGLQSDKTHLAEIVLTNVDSSQADVDLAFFGPKGRIVVQGARSIVVRPSTTVHVSLEPLFSAEGPVSVQVRTSAGRVVAAARQRLMVADGSAAIASDWVSTQPKPTTTVVIPGVPAGAGERNLVLANPGAKRVSAKVEIMTATGTATLVDAESVSIGMESTIVVPIEAALRSESVTIRVTATNPVTAALLVRAGAEGDLAVLTGAPELRGTAIVAIPTAAKSALMFANGGDAPTTVVVRPHGGGSESIVTVPAHGIANVAVASGVEALEVEAHQPVFATLTLTEDLSGLAGLAVFALQTADLARSDIVLREDPVVAR